MNTISKIKVGGTTYDIAYPVGSIYLSVNSTSPANLFGGTWEQIKDTFLLACGGTYSAGSKGGEAKHTLTIDEMPAHSHSKNGANLLSDSGKTGGFGSAIKTVTGDYVAELIPPSASMTGGSKSHNNMPPYLAVYMWKRVA
nr:MAG TPA: baseplate wedge protein [Caudoviricetes sp.]